MRRQRQIQSHSQRWCLAGTPLRTGHPPRPRPTLGLGKILGTRGCVARHRQVRKTRDRFAWYRQVRGTRDRIARHWQIPRTRTCFTRYRQVGGTRNRVARRRQVVGPDWRSHLEDGAAVYADVVNASGWNVATDFLSFRTFWTDDSKGRHEIPRLAIVAFVRPATRTEERAGDGDWKDRGSARSLLGGRGIPVSLYVLQTLRKFAHE
jgi:hypothetical protein